MINKKELITDVVEFVNENGLNGIDPIILNESGNLVVHLQPYDVVARIVLVNGKNSDLTRTQVEREIDVATHLNLSGTIVVKPSSIISPGPHRISSVWVSFWEYEEEVEIEEMRMSVAMKCLNSLNESFSTYKADLPVLGVWNRVKQSALQLKGSDNAQIESILNHFEEIDSQIRLIPVTDLVPSHGDAHVKNLIQTSRGWAWMDFEDASLMPKNWDIASFFANIVLFKGVKSPILDNILNQSSIAIDKEEFRTIFLARVLMSIIGNYDLANQGYGDMEFAQEQLSKFNEFYSELCLW